MHSDRLRHRVSRAVTRRPSVVIAGAGIVGAALAYHLASAGAAATIVERSRPASGVTARSFAWINIIHGNAPDLARLRNLAIADYRRLERELDGALTWLVRMPDALGEELLIVQKEFDGFAETRERLDLLALD